VTNLLYNLQQWTLAYLDFESSHHEMAFSLHSQ